MGLTKFIVHSASHQANTNASISLIQNGKFCSWDEFRTETDWKIFIKLSTKIMHMEGNLSSYILILWIRNKLRIWDVIIGPPCNSYICYRNVHNSHSHLQLFAVHIIQRTIQMKGQPCYQTWTIRMAHIAIQDVWNYDNTLANFKTRECKSLMLYIYKFLSKCRFCAKVIDINISNIKRNNNNNNNNISRERSVYEMLQ